MKFQLIVPKKDQPWHLWLIQVVPNHVCVVRLVWRSQIITCHPPLRLFEDVGRGFLGVQLTGGGTWASFRTESDPSEHGRKVDVALRDVGQWAILVMGRWLGWMILEMFSNLNDAIIQWCSYSVNDTETNKQKRLYLIIIQKVTEID